MVAAEKRVLASHDVRTLTAFAYARINAGLGMTGLIEAGPGVPIAAAIADLLLIAECGEPRDSEGQIIYLPLR